jgi:hypothetical protein
MKERWKEVLQAIEKASGARSAAACIDDAYQEGRKGRRSARSSRGMIWLRAAGAGRPNTRSIPKTRSCPGASVAYARKQAEYKRKESPIGKPRARTDTR